MGSSGTNLVDSRYYIIRFGPYSKASPTDPNINVDHYKKVLIICNRKDKRLCDNLKNDLEKGLPNNLIFKPFNEIFGTKLDFQVVEYDSDRYDEEKIMKVYEDEYEPRTFPLVITPKLAKSQIDSIYYRVKASFLDSGLEERATPTQIVTVDLLKQRDENKNTNYSWSLLPIAVQMFTKMGGIPYALKQSCINIGSEFNVHFIGLGLTSDPRNKLKRVGFVTIFNDNGSLSYMDSNILEDNKTESYGRIIYNAINRIVNLSNTNKSSNYNILVVHYSGKSLSKDDDQLIRNAIQIALSKKRNIEVYVAKVSKSNIFLIDTDSKTTDKQGSLTYHPRIGIVLKLKDNLYLMNMGGAITDRKINLPTGGFPSTLLISIHKELSSGESLDDDDLVKSVFIMSRVSYSNLSNPVLSEPITIKYSRSIAYLTLRLSYLNEKIELPEHIKKVMWFI
ncbi:hypothetical protein Stok01_00483 [Sulfurisphaera tokodaii]